MSTVGRGVRQPSTMGPLGQAIRRAEGVLRALTNRLLSDLDVTATQHAVLAAVADSPGLSNAQLARTCGVAPQTMTTVVANLESQRLIERTPSAVHSRVMISTVTPTGRRVLRRAQDATETAEGRLTDAFAPHELDQLHSYLDRVVSALATR